ncbi:MAG: hypothetical protein HY787_02855 [Deltaproteobacteria bacterium]|nr:hypothetical protein [Deltaproteobacteria bacterium]
MSAYHCLFDRSQLELEPLANRRHLLDLTCLIPLKPAESLNPIWETIADRILSANRRNSAVILMMGAHVLRSGVQRYLIDLIQRGCISCLALNGAGMIHDYEFALIGATTENVADYISDGRFGLWQETGRINDIVKEAARSNIGLGEAVGRVIEEENFPHREISLLATAYRCRIPITVHVGIGYDILHEHPNCDGAAYGQTSYNDFLVLAQVIHSLEGGVVMNFGSAIMAPEVFLKALAMARNVARQEGRLISSFSALVCDLLDLPPDYHSEASPGTPGYYFRPWKTLLVRTVADGGESFYVKGYHAETVRQLWTAVNRQKGEN